jgi:tight adherence protein B
MAARWAQSLVDLGAPDGHPPLGWVLGAVGLVVAALAVVSPVLGVAALAVGLAAPPLARPAITRRVRDRRDAQLPDLLDRVGAALRSGGSLPGALVAAARAAQPPLDRDLAAVAAEIEHGSPTAAALQRWAVQPSSSPDVRLTATALALGATAGGAVARSVDQVAATLRERRQLRAEVRALATQARSSTVVLVLAPPAFTLLLSTVEPSAVRFLLASPPGLACLAIGSALDLLGAAWMARILRSVA